MPIYEILTVQGTLTAEQRTTLAETITTIHAEETDAPADFIHVVFPELPSGHAFTAGRPSAPALIRGQVRAGRSPEVRVAIQQRINDAYAELTDAEPMSILVAILDVPAKWVMEAGRILPEPDKAEEQAWLAALHTQAAQPTA